MGNCIAVQQEPPKYEKEKGETLDVYTKKIIEIKYQAFRDFIYLQITDEKIKKWVAENPHSKFMKLQGYSRNIIKDEKNIGLWNRRTEKMKLWSGSFHDLNLVLDKNYIFKC